MGGITGSTSQVTWTKHRYTDKKKLDSTDAKVLQNVASKTDAVVSKVVGTPVALASATASGNAVQAAAETAKAVTQKVPTANDTVKTGVANGATVAAGVVAAAKGDTFTAAAAAQTVLDNAPALAPLALAADVVLLAKGNGKLQAQAASAAKDIKTLTASNAGPAAKIKSGLNLATNAQSTLVMSKQIGKAADGVLDFAERSQALAPSAGIFRRAWSWVMETPIGSVVRGLGKIMPFLNVAALANSAWVAHEVFKDPKSSTTTKGLSVASILASAGMFAASVISALSPLTMPFAIGGVAVELALFYARRNDQALGDTDKVFAHAIEHPGEGFKMVGETLSKGLISTAEWMDARVAKGWHSLFGGSNSPKAAKAGN